MEDTTTVGLHALDTQQHKDGFALLSAIFGCLHSGDLDDSDK